jgi:nucleotide-binding universal stress UspA family protein
MILANILVHLDSRPRTQERLALALRLAERSGARVTGLFAEQSEAHLVGTVATWPSPRYVVAVETARKAFAEATTSLAARASFMDINRGSDQEIAHRFVAVARTFDLVILGQTQDDVPVPAKLPEHVIVEGGRPTLVVPYVGSYREVGRRPLFAWHNSRGAARAVSDSLPLIAENCDGLIVEVGRRNEQRDEFAELLVSNLAAHKVGARYQHFIVDEISVMDTLLSAVSDHAADLLAIGAFDSGVHALLGHGVGTRHILAHMTTPVLFSH